MREGNKNAVKHGKRHTAAYNVWTNLQTRCNNPNSPKYTRYGGRGITVSWESFADFYRDMGDKPDGLLLDRADNNGDYSKDNCRWADPRESAQNTSTSKWWVIGDKRYPSATAAAEALGISRHRIRVMCNGRTIRGKFHPPKTGCYTELKYGTQVGQAFQK